jgi:hypothetical protein
VTRRAAKPKTPAAPLFVRTEQRISIDSMTSEQLRARLKSPREAIAENATLMRADADLALSRPDVAGTHAQAKRIVSALDDAPRLDALADEAVLAAQLYSIAAESHAKLRANALFADSVSHSRGAVKQHTTNLKAANAARHAQADAKARRDFRAWHGKRPVQFQEQPMGEKVRVYCRVKHIAPGSSRARRLRALATEGTLL